MKIEKREYKVYSFKELSKEAQKKALEQLSDTNVDHDWWIYTMPTPTPEIKARLEYLRQELQAERISYGELAELSSLKEYIEDGDVELLEPAGVPEFDCPVCGVDRCRKEHTEEEIEKAEQEGLKEDRASNAIEAE